MGLGSLAGPEVLSGPAAALRAAKTLLTFARHRVTGFHLITLNLWTLYKVTPIVTYARRLHSVAAGYPSNLAISSEGTLRIVWSGKGET